MRMRTVSLPELGLIAGTRAVLGAGVGLLLADRLNNDQRRAIGWTLVAVGVLSTFPLAAEVVFRRDHSREPAEPEPQEWEARYRTAIGS
jgi:uncharacterized membrane protein YfcA